MEHAALADRIALAETLGVSPGYMRRVATAIEEERPKLIAEQGGGRGNPTLYHREAFLAYWDEREERGRPSFLKRLSLADRRAFEAISKTATTNALVKWCALQGVKVSKRTLQRYLQDV